MSEEEVKLTVRIATTKVPLKPDWIAKAVIQLSQIETDRREREYLKYFQHRKKQLGQLTNEHFVNLGPLEVGADENALVHRDLHNPTGFVMARKVIPITRFPQVYKLILRDLELLHEYNSSYIVGFYGAFYNDQTVSVCTEFMNGGSLDLALTRFGKIPENALGKITLSVLGGLAYLKNKHSVRHGNLKPANILVNWRGEVKLCDVVTSKLLLAACKKTEEKPRCYTAPEALIGEERVGASDIWSLGISLIELATEIFPIPNCCESGDGKLNEYSLEDMENYIIDEPPPQLPPGEFSSDFENFVSGCLEKDPDERHDLTLLISHAWIDKWEDEDIDFIGLVTRRIEEVVESDSSQVLSGSEPSSSSQEENKE